MNDTVEIRQATAMKEGDGADVRRLMPVRGFMNFDPFVLWDDFTVKPGAGFPPHPHRGFEAITYMFSGTMQHEDNLGNKSTVEAGGAQRFTAGKGLVHSEMPSMDEPSHGIQLWINLPKRLKAIDPAYQQVNRDEFPEHTIEKGKVRIIVGENSPLTLLTPVRYLDVQLDADGIFKETLPAEYRGLVYLVEGQVNLNGERISAGAACFFDQDAGVKITAIEKSRIMLCFGRPHHESIRQHGPYVD